MPERSLAKYASHEWEVTARVFAATSVAVQTVFRNSGLELRYERVGREKLGLAAVMVDLAKFIVPTTVVNPWVSNYDRLSRNPISGAAFSTYNWYSKNDPPTPEALGFDRLPESMTDMPRYLMNAAGKTSLVTRHAVHGNRMQPLGSFRRNPADRGGLMEGEMPYAGALLYDNEHTVIGMSGLHQIDDVSANIHFAWGLSLARDAGVSTRLSGKRTDELASVLTDMLYEDAHAWREYAREQHGTEHYTDLSTIATEDVLANVIGGHLLATDLA